MKFYFVFFRAASLICFLSVIWAYHFGDFEFAPIGIMLLMGLAFEACASLKNLGILLKKEFEKNENRYLDELIEKKYKRIKHENHRA